MRGTPARGQRFTSDGGHARGRAASRRRPSPPPHRRTFPSHRQSRRCSRAPRALCRPTVSRSGRQGAAGPKETPLFFEFSLCLSRACLGQMMHFIYKWREKWRSFTQLLKNQLPSTSTSMRRESSKPQRRAGRIEFQTVDATEDAADRQLGVLGAHQSKCGRSRKLRSRHGFGR